MFRLIKKKKHVYFIVYFIIFILIERPSYAPPPTPAPATVSKQFYKPLTLYYQQYLKYFCEFSPVGQVIVRQLFHPQYMILYGFWSGCYEQ